MGAATQNVIGQRSRPNSLLSKENAFTCRLNPKSSMKNCVQKSPLYGLRCSCQFGPVMLALWLGLSCASAFPLLSSNQLVFVNVDHAPMGTCSTMTYGWKGQICGIGISSGDYPYWNGGGGVLIALSGSSGLQLLPFVTSAS